MSYHSHPALKRYALLLGFLGLLFVPLFVALRPDQQFINHGETVSVPRYMSNATAISSNAFQEDRRIIVSMPNVGETYLGKFRSTGEELIQRIRKLADALPPSDRIVYVKGGVSVSHGSIVELLEIVRAAGIDRVRLLVKKEKAPTGEDKAGFLEVQLPRELAGR